MKQKLKGYLTPEGYLGEIRKGVFQMFSTEEEWMDYLKTNSEPDIADKVEIDN